MTILGLPPGLMARVFLATFLWGTAFPMNKMALSQLQPMGLGGSRFLLSGILLLLVSGFSGRLVNSDRSTPPATIEQAGGRWQSLGRILAMAFVGNALFYGFFYAGMSRTSASSAAVADGSGPIISAFLAHFLLKGDRLTARKFGSLILAFGGVFVVAFSRTSTAAGASPVGCGLILLAMTFGSLGTMMIVRYRGPLRLMQIVGLQHLFGGAMLLAASLWTEGPSQFLRLLHLSGFGPVVYLAFVSAVAFRIWYGVVREYKVTSVAVFSFVTAIWGALLSILILGEKLTPGLVVGLVLVVAAVLVLHGTKSRLEDHKR